jgi:hypothetical protein
MHSYTVPLAQWSSHLLPDMRDPCSIPRWVRIWNRDSPVSVVSLHWWPRHDCDNPTCPHTALLSRFHARWRSSFRLHNWYSRLLGGALWRACNLTTFIHSSTGPVVHLFASRHEGAGFNPQGGYIGDPVLIDHCDLVWGGLCPEPSLGLRTDNVIIPLDLTQLFRPSFTLAAGPPSSFTTDIVGCWGEALWRACIHTQFHGPSGPPICFPSWGSRVQSPGGYLRETGILLLVLSSFKIKFKKWAWEKEILDSRRCLWYVR